MTDELLASLAEDVHRANARWWTDLETGLPYERNVGELLMLIISELSEALEAHRKNLQDDKLTHRQMFEVELADALIRTLDMIGGLKLTVRLPPTQTFPLTENTAENLLLLAAVYIRAYSYKDVPVFLSAHLAVAVRGLEDLATRMQLDLMGAFREKLSYNATRYDHSVEGRLAAGGKKY